MDDAWIETVRREIVGLDAMVPLLQGGERNYINLDNAATTPALKSVTASVSAFLDWYASVHRGAGFKSRLSTFWYEEARREVLDFVGGNPDDHVVVFVRNATEGINLIAHRVLTADPDAWILTSDIEHHSNMLPWRASSRVHYIGANDAGVITEDALERHLRMSGGRVRLVAITGASNVTGVVQPVHRLAAISHEHDAILLVDGAQLVPHRRVRMGSINDTAHIDVLVFSGHKIYAPFGCGAVVASRRVFRQGQPMLVGGGMVRSVTLDDAEWADPPESDEAGSPNVVGAIALVAALLALKALGMEAVKAYEAELTSYAIKRLKEVRALTIYGSTDIGVEYRVGVLTFNLQSLPHGLVAAVLAYEHAIGVRNGCFCAHPLLFRLLGLSASEVMTFRERLRFRRREQLPGAVRASLAMYTTREEIDALVDGLEALSAGDVHGSYHEDSLTGEFVPDRPVGDVGKVFDPGLYVPRTFQTLGRSLLDVLR